MIVNARIATRYQIITMAHINVLYKIFRFLERMFSTDEAVDVTLLCDNCCMKSVVDKFGMKIKTRSVGEEQFRTTVKVCAGPTFYRWVFGAGGKIVIESPIETRNEYREMLQEALNQL